MPERVLLQKEIMTTLKIAVFASVMAFLPILCKAASSDTVSSPKYIIGPGDLVEISVWNHPELTKEVSVRPDGWLSFPLIGEICASGANPEVLSKQIKLKLLPYLKDPKVSVIVSKYRSKRILVLGEVKKPGAYQYEGGLTAFDAVGLAEGYNKHAQLKSIVVVRNPYDKQPNFYLANLYKAIHDGNLKENIILMPGDIVYVPQNFIGNAGDFFDYFMTKIRPAADSYFIYELAVNAN
jgi:polysaccharide biosynthesis/export protein